MDKTTMAIGDADGSAAVSLKKNTSKLTLLLMFFTLLAPMLLASVLFNHQQWVPQNTVNQGLLIDPPIAIGHALEEHLKKRPLNNPSADNKTTSGHPKQWLLLHALNTNQHPMLEPHKIQTINSVPEIQGPEIQGPEIQDQEVQDQGHQTASLHPSLIKTLVAQTRNVHIRLGKDAHRVQRLAILPNAAHHPELSLHSELTTWLQQDPRLTLVDNAILSSDSPLKRLLADYHTIIIDPNGFAILGYNQAHTPSQLLKDIKRLLKYSYEHRQG